MQYTVHFIDAESIILAIGRIEAENILAAMQIASVSLPDGTEQISIEIAAEEQE